jgi:DNA-directed RNA polymerase subunit RPC12/RpoP
VERNLNQSELEETLCASCGEEFERPLLAKLHSDSMIEEYYACPRCLSKVGEVKLERRKEADEIEEEESPGEETLNAETVKTEETQSCPYYVGYLRKRQKGTPIPEGCLTCSKMIECI